MKSYDASQIRNVAILGHQGSGKTTLVESMAYVAKLIPEKGSVERKTTISDYTQSEQKRGGSVQTSIIPLYVGDHKINVIDDENEEYLSIEDEDLLETLFDIFKQKYEGEIDFE